MLTKSLNCKMKAASNLLLFSRQIQSNGQNYIDPSNGHKWTWEKARKLRRSILVIYIKKRKQNEETTLGLAISHIV